MRTTETYQETSNLGLFALAALVIHGAAIFFGYLGAPSEKHSAPQKHDASESHNATYEIVVDEDALGSAIPATTTIQVSAGLQAPSNDAPSVASAAAVSSTSVPALKTTDTVKPGLEGSAQVALEVQPDSLEHLGVIIGTSPSGDLAAGSVAALGRPAGRGFLGRARSGGAAATSGKGHLAHYKATLVAQSPCTDLFPFGARIASATVAVKVDVDPTGKARLIRVLSGLPHAGGFGAATMACSARLRFEPARDASGAAITSQAVVRLHFERNG